jgi:hypothetical protein
MNNLKKNLLGAIQLCTIVLLTTLMAASAQAQTPAATANENHSNQTRQLALRPQFRELLRPAGLGLLPASNSHTNANSGSTTNLLPMAGPNLTVQGSGTIGRLPKWTGFTGSNATIGDSTIFEDKFGKVGIGTDSPASRLTVVGMVETTLSGYKFPDGTIQTTSAANALLSVVHDTTLTGNGTQSSPLGVAVPLILSGSVNNGNGVITVTNTAAGGPGIFAVGGLANATIGGGSGLLALGGTGFNTSPGGVGLVGFGGSASTGSGGTGGTLIGGVSTAGNGGDGSFVVGALGVGTGNQGGRGLVAIPGGGAGGATVGLAGEFLGDVEVSGNLSKGGGSFKIDHPLDPENKYLYHSFVESPDMKNIYDGNITTDQNGDATVELPAWFEALNKDFRYQLTVIGTFAQAIVADEIKDNRFRVKTSAANVKVSWQVTGIRQDAYANKHRIKVEEDKTERERGFYLHPEAFNQPEERGIEWARHPQMMQQTKVQRERQMEELKQKAQSNDR